MKSVTTPERDDHKLYLVAAVIVLLSILSSLI